MSTEVLELNNLSLAYDGAVVCQGIDLLVHPGEWVSIMGLQGGGKSSVLRSIAGLAPHHGSIQLEGGSLTNPRTNGSVRDGLSKTLRALSPHDGL